MGSYFNSPKYVPITVLGLNSDGLVLFVLGISIVLLLYLFYRNKNAKSPLPIELDKKVLEAASAVSLLAFFAFSYVFFNPHATYGFYSSTGDPNYFIVLWGLISGIASIISVVMFLSKD